MTSTKPAERDWSATLFLPKTDFPMRAGLPQTEPKLIERWARLNMYTRLREAAKGREKFVLHDGPPYANGNIHIGHALNKILKDLVTRSQQMLGRDSNYVPGWDCHGLPIEWEIEKRYAAKGRKKDDVPVNEFRKECRAFAEHWINVQREEFRRLGVEGDWWHPYSTMDFRAEGTIANELMKFAVSGALYRGSKPVMWSVVEKTALAEAEVEYQDFVSDQIWVKFPVVKAEIAAGPLRSDGKILAASDVEAADVLIWTTTPWTIPGNRAISYNPKINYGLYEVVHAPEGNWAKRGEYFVLADELAAAVFKAARIEPDGWRRLARIDPGWIATCAHPLRDRGYDFEVPLLIGDHVTDEDGTGFVHTAPGHGRDDFDIWTAKARELRVSGIETAIPFTVDGDGRFTKEAPGFEGKRVITEKGDKGDANEAIIKTLADAGMLIARGRLKHQYPHSWRSKKPVIFRNTPQWFIAMDKPFPIPGHGNNHSLRQVALEAIDDTGFVPKTGQNRIRGMIEAKPDWVLSRQRAWGVPITVFVHKETGEVIPNGRPERTKLSTELIARVTAAIQARGADAWFDAGAQERFLTGLVDDPSQWEHVTDILDVWFDSGSTHAFTLEDPAAFPQLAGICRAADGGKDRVMYLEGSDQHRGWFHSSLLESCGTRGRAPFDLVLTHGFVLDEKGQKMSKSVGNVVAPQDVIKQSGADILRLWTAASDYSDDLRIGPEILKTFVETYRKVRNTLRWMLGTLAHFEPEHIVEREKMPELERLMLHRLAELEPQIRRAYAEYDYKKVVALLAQFMNTDLSAFYFDIRKDALYCEPPSSLTRHAALTAIEHIFRCVSVWLAPILVFTAEEAWLARYPSDDGSVHVELFPELPADWRDEALDAKWDRIRRVRSVITGALELERAGKRIGSSLEAHPVVHIEDDELRQLVASIDLAEVAITSAATVKSGPIPDGAFRLDGIRGVGVAIGRAAGRKCARSWRYTLDVGSDPDFPDLSARDARAVREIEAGQ